MSPNRSPLRIAHLSDLHFSKITFHPKQFFSKQWIGNWNLILFRRNRYQTEHLFHIPELLKQLDVEVVCITGDVATTSQDNEFQLAKTYLALFRSHDLPFYLVPGNHDFYTTKSSKTKAFYNFFPSPALKAKKVMQAELGKGWFYVGLDCAVATPWFQSYGIFSHEIENELDNMLREIPSEGRVILANHFPLFSTGRAMHDLQGCERLQQLILRFPQVKLYLHGHDHKPYIVDRRDEGYPLVLNSGSCAHSPDGTFYLLDLSEKSCLVEQFYYLKEADKISWVIRWQKSYAHLR